MLQRTARGAAGRWGERVALGAATLSTWAFELVLAERKYGLFGGGFGQSHALAGAGETTLFVGATLLAQLIAAALLYRLIWALLARRARPAVRLFTYLFVACGLGVAAAAAKFEVLSYFSDAVSFQLLRNLGGGSLVDAALFAMSEGALYAEVALGALLAYLLGLFLIRRLLRAVPPSRPLPAIRWRGLALAAVLLVPVAAVTDRVGDARYAASRMSAFALGNLTLNTLTDFDRDGYSWFSALRDEAPFDASRHPLALDVPDNGVDEDGIGGDFHLARSAAAEPLPALPQRPRNVVLIVLESTRGDVLGKRVNGKVVAPNLVALARGGSSAAEAYSHVGFTTASLKSLFSGALDPRAGDPSLFRDLKRAGYRVGVFSGQPEDFGDISAVTGMRSAADVFVDASTLKDERAFSFGAQGSLLVDESKLLARFDKALGDPRGWQRPTFVYFNFQSAHFPYHHPGMADLIEPHPLPRGEIALANRARVERTYWNAVAYSDSMIGAVVARLKALGVWDDTLLVVTADHGESLFDDGFLGHGHIINREQTHIPLVLSVPGIALSGPIGLDDYRRIILDSLAGRQARASGELVFQYIGVLDAPTAIGMAEAGGRQTSLNLESEELWLSESGRRFAYRDLPAGSPNRARADRLIHMWESERWLARGRAR